MSINNCPSCLEKQRKIDQLTEEIERLRKKLYCQERKAKEGFFGSSTPSSQIPIKPNAEQPRPAKPKGAKPGHPGAGRKSFDPAASGQVVEVEAECAECPECGGPLRDKGCEQRSVWEAPPFKPQSTVYRLPKKYCPHCRRTFKPKPSSVLPKSLYGNQLLANVAVEHYQHGQPMGRLCDKLGLHMGSLVNVFHRMAGLLHTVPEKLIAEYRKAPAKHADETGWRMAGKNCYAWLFATPQMSIFQFGKNRSAKIPHAVFGEKKVPGVLVVDRYNGYNQMPCAIQYCYAHLLRELQDLEKEFPAEKEIQNFVAAAAPLLAQAMSLRTKPIQNKIFYARAEKIKKKIMAVMNQPAKHLGIRRLQDIFCENAARLYHWADDRRIPAHNNLAERDLRPSVIARKVSFGSASQDGANTRSILTTVIQTLTKRGFDPATRLKQALDVLAKDMNQDPYPLLFNSPGHR